MTEGTSVPEAECDLVMRGGVTSGAVYPSALMEIAKRHKLRNVGGASAGAIAAAGAAACEFGRRTNPAAFDRLQEVTTQIAEQGFVRNLFQPKKETRLAFDIGVKTVSPSEGKYSRRVLRAAGTLLRRRPRSLVQGAISLVLLAAVVAAAAFALAGGPTWLGVVGLVVLAVLALVGVGLVVAALALRGFAMELNSALLQGGFGLCTGMTEPGHPEGSGLTDWLHKTIQACAGRDDDDPPLTFADLVVDPTKPLLSFQLVTTDLTASRPVVLPLPPTDSGQPPYLFERSEFERLFPASVVEHLVEGLEPSDETPDDKPLYELPRLDLPIVVAVRLSLSFPVLMETVPLWKKDDPKGDPVCHLMSDGGISSNFPIHFFDALLPGRPTFGLDLQPLRGSAQRFEMGGPLRSLFEKVEDLPTFGIQIVNAARNWRDNMQAELIGYRDRICQIRLADDEGGLNLDMDPKVVAGLIALGRDAGREVVRTSTAEWWDEHRVTRYRMLMQMLQRSLGREGAGRDCVYRVPRGTDCGAPAPFRERLSAYANGTAKLGDLDPSWCRKAMPASDVFIGVAALLGAGGAIDFDEGAPTPTPTMRIVPTV
jgi:predicted acylesterase/phospholipase RssA